jgi:hypothetical protein
MDGTDLPVALQTLFTSDELDQIARKCGCIQRERLLNGRLLAQTLVFGLLHAPEATGSQLAQTAAVLGLTISPQALEQRIAKPQTADFIKAVLEIALGVCIAAPKVTSERLQRFAEVNLLDSTTVRVPDAFADIWPGCGGTNPKDGKAALKIQVRMDLVGGGLTLKLCPGREPDQKTALQTQDIKEGSLHLRDLGYFDINVLKTIADAKGFFLTRLMSNTAVYHEQGNPLDLLALLRKSPDDVDCQVRVGSRMHLPVRLIARRLPDQVANLRRRRLRKKARRKSRYEPTKQAVGLRGWQIAITNAPAEKLSIDDALALLRVRWQIELLFKLWKSHGRLGHSRRRKAHCILTETYAKLLAMLIQHWVLWQALGEYVDRSMVKGAASVRAFAWLLLRSFVSLQMLRSELERMLQIIRKTARIHRRRKQPSAYQILEDPVKYGYKRRA